jgi:hypothetical protein
MPETNNVPDSAQLLAGFLTAEQLEAQLGWKWRTRLRREADGLPVIRIGSTKLYPADKVRAWILSHVRERVEPCPGRPRKSF